jgi:hypothetical protein
MHIRTVDHQNALLKAFSFNGVTGATPRSRIHLSTRKS